MARQVEEPVFKCYVHNFGCVEPSEWSDHIGSVEHTHTGTTTCKDCGEPNIAFSYTGTLKGGQTPSAYCETCKERLRKSLGV